LAKEEEKKIIYTIYKHSDYDFLATPYTLRISWSIGSICCDIPHHL